MLPHLPSRCVVHMKWTYLEVTGLYVVHIHTRVVNDDAPTFSDYVLNKVRTEMGTTGFRAIYVRVLFSNCSNIRRTIALDKWSATNSGSASK